MGEWGKKISDPTIRRRSLYFRNVTAIHPLSHSPILPVSHYRILLLSLTLSVSLSLSVFAFGDEYRYEYFRLRMGTTARIVLYAGDEREAGAAAAAAFDRIQELDEVMSDYNPESELSRFSRDGAAGPQVLTPDLFIILEKSLDYSRISQGAFDITVGPLVALWRQARREKRLPEQESLKGARNSVGYSKILLDRDARTACLRATGMKLDLGGIAKGYAADQALAVLSRKGIRSALVALGGDIGVSGAPPAQSGWRIAIQAPISPEEFDKELVLRHCGVSTSGDTEQFVEIDGVRYSHVVDPRTGWSLRDSPFVTVIAPNSTTADALATALSVLPPERGLQLAESEEGVAVRILRRSGDGRYKKVESRKWKVESGK